MFNRHNQLDNQTIGRNASPYNRIRPGHAILVHHGIINPRLKFGHPFAHLPSIPPMIGGNSAPDFDADERISCLTSPALMMVCNSRATF